MRALCILIALATAVPDSATPQDSKVDAAVERHQAEIIELRHQIHQNPELGNREFRTAQLVAGHLRALGLEVQTGVAHTGVVGILRGGNHTPNFMADDSEAYPGLLFDGEDRRFLRLESYLGGW